MEDLRPRYPKATMTMGSMILPLTFTDYDYMTEFQLSNEVWNDILMLDASVEPEFWRWGDRPGGMEAFQMGTRAFTGYTVLFTRESDAVWFKLKWGG